MTDDRKKDAQFRFSRRGLLLGAAAGTVGAAVPGMPAQAAAADANDYKSAFVLAQLLYKSGKKSEALKWAEKAQTGFAANPEAPVVQKLFKAENIGPFVEKLKAEL